MSSPSAMPSSAREIEDHAAQECYWELERFLRLALKANPNVLECLYTPLVEHATPLAEELVKAGFVLTRFADGN